MSNLSTEQYRTLKKQKQVNQEKKRALESFRTHDIEKSYEELIIWADRSKELYLAQELISIADRYKSASAELTQRMGGRQLTYLGYAVAAATYINTTAGKSFDNPSFVIAIPAVVCFAFSAWIRSQDLIVGLLSAYCRICEEQTHLPNMPSFYSAEQGWYRIAMRHREWMELAFIMISVLLINSAFFIKWPALSAEKPELPQVMALCINQLIFGVCAWMILSIPEHRSRMLKLTLVPAIRKIGAKDTPFFTISEDIRKNQHPIDFFLELLILLALFAICGWLLLYLCTNHAYWFLVIFAVLLIGVFLAAGKASKWQKEDSGHDGPSARRDQAGRLKRQKEDSGHDGPDPLDEPDSPWKRTIFIIIVAVAGLCGFCLHRFSKNITFSIEISVCAIALLMIMAGYQGAECMMRFLRTNAAKRIKEQKEIVLLT